MVRVADQQSPALLLDNAVPFMVLLTRLDDLAEIVAVRPMASAISALAWSADGAMLAWGSDSGFAGIFSARQSV